LNGVANTTAGNAAEGKGGRQQRSPLQFLDDRG
jgi:hypothetical protein